MSTFSPVHGRKRTDGKLQIGDAGEADRVKLLDRTEVLRDLARLRRSFDAGRTRPVAWRRQQLERLRDLLVSEEPALLQALHDDLGERGLQGWLCDLRLVVREIDYALHYIERWQAPRRVRVPLALQPARAYTDRQPLGVALVISSWNYPVNLALTPLIGAIAAGNCALLKPSEVAASTASLLADLVPRYLDPEAVAVFTGGPAETEALLGERFDVILFTGSTVVGRQVMKAAAEHLTPVILELGGKSPCIVHRSAHVDVAARRIAWGKFLNAGQTCVAPDYVLVDEKLADDLHGELVESVSRLLGADPRHSPDYSRIISDKHAQRLARLLEGQRVTIGGPPEIRSGYMPPTIVVDPDPSSALMQEEIFGPILPVLKVSDLDEALSFVRRRPNPLALYAFVRDKSAEKRILATTTSGAVCFNEVVSHLALPELPLGGVGESGLGAYHGRFGFEAFSRERAILSKPARLDPGVRYPPFGPAGTRLMKWLT